jgi:hypothetical protein
MSLNTNAADRADHLIVLTERLTELVALEATALEERRPQDILERIEETGRLANVYRHESGRIRANPDLLKGLAPDVHRKLIQATEALDAVLARQGRALEAAKTVTEGLVRAIAEEVAAQRSRSESYGPGATVAAPSAGIAITLNRRA